MQRNMQISPFILNTLHLAGEVLKVFQFIYMRLKKKKKEIHFFERERTGEEVRKKEKERRRKEEVKVGDKGLR